MAHSLMTYIILFFIFLSAAACTAKPAAVTPTPTPTSPPLPFPTVVPTLVPATSIPTQAPTSTPDYSSLYLPIGIASLSTPGGNIGTYNLQGQSLGELQAPNFTTGAYPLSAFSGQLSISPSVILPPFIYYVPSNGGELWQNAANNNTLIRAAPNLLNISGAPGKSSVAYTLLEFQDVGLRSDLYLSEVQGIPAAQSVLQNTSTESLAIQSLAISMENGEPVGVWYTSVPYGIGGDIVFAPRKSLRYLYLPDYQILDYLDMSKAPVGISEDKTWIAYTPAIGVGPITIAHNFDFAAAITFPLREDSDRGAGDAVFSPDIQYVAWREAGGSLSGQPAPLRETIRIGSVDGTVIAEYPDTSLITASGFSEVTWVLPLGWLDPQTLALEVRSGSTNTAAILAVKLDGTSITYLVPGTFIGFLYP